jgi:hypothetical protein
MVKCTMACVAETAIESKDTGTMSLVQIIEAVQASTFPLVMPRLTAVFFLERESADSETLSLRFRASTPSLTIVEQGVDVAFSGKPRARLTINFLGFPIPEIGKIRFEVLTAEGTALGGWSIEVQAASTVAVGNAPPSGMSAVLMSNSSSKVM